MARIHEVNGEKPVGICVENQAFSGLLSVCLQKALTSVFFGEALL